MEGKKNTPEIAHHLKILVKNITGKDASEKALKI
jgi:hypothetical protein